ncbi:ATP-binding protein [Streptomyces paludis]|uniref:ATP-binding protein n=1 Tax=Streptomyces paludis TaxID=2282738 RepID=A0A345HT05_9ACTN|nr:ATP-binding protein [Streptomyces paludis]AXG79829.1 ATP-binding protein [Streptomyces paludis]
MTADQEVPGPQEFVPVAPVVLFEDCLSYAPVTGSVTLARRRAGQVVAEWGRPELAWSAALLVSELATNALLHGCLRGRLFQVRVTLRTDVLRIEVSDAREERLPVPRVAGDGDCFGRGLVIVRELADRWGVGPRTVGKTVFAEIGLELPER